MTQEVINYCKEALGWIDPPKEFIAEAALQIERTRNNWRTGDYLLHSGLLPVSRLNELFELSANKSGFYYDNIISVAQAAEKEILLENRNRIIAQSLNVQCVKNFDSQVTLLHSAMKDKKIYAECQKMNAVICLIQDVTPIVVFAEHSSSFSEFNSLSGVNKKFNPIYAHFQDQKVLCGLAINPDLVLEAKQIEGDGDDEDENDQIVKSYKLKEHPLRRKLASIHDEALKLNATDIHIIPEQNSSIVKVQVRVYTVMVDLPKSFWLEKEEYKSIRDFLVSKASTSANFSALQRVGDGRYTYMSEAGSVEVRSAFCNKGTETSINRALITIRLRLIPKQQGGVNLDDIGVPSEIKEHMHQSMLAEHGLVVMVGPTGSGKSTTLFGMVDLHRQIHGDGASRLSIEDPIERFVPGIDQVQVKSLPSDNEDDNLLLEYLRTFVRMDPDFILMGEIRCAQTAEMAAQQAITGHKALTTIHAGNTVQALQRLIVMLPNSNLQQMMVTALDYFFGQRLIPKLCKCGEVRNITEREKKRIEMFFARADVTNYKLPQQVRDKNEKGCEECKGMGVIGVLPSHEVLPMNTEVKSLAVRGGIDNFAKIRALRTHTIEQATLKHITELNAPLSALFSGT